MKRDSLNKAMSIDPAQRKNYFSRISILRAGVIALACCQATESAPASTSKTAPPAAPTALVPESERATSLMTDWPEKSQLVSLKLASGQTVLSIFIPTTLPRPSGAILVFPDFSLGPAQQGITQYISQRFPTYGWAVQLMNSPDFDLWAQGLPDTNRWNQAEDLLLSRLQASLAELSTRGYHNMVVLAQGSSGLALIKAFARIPPPPSVRGLILLAPPSWPQQPHPIAESLPKLDLPVLIEYDHANLTDQPGCELCIRVAAQLHKDLQEYFQPDQNADFPSTAPLVANTLLSWLDLRAGTVLPATSTGVAAHPVP